MTMQGTSAQIFDTLARVLIRCFVGGVIFVTMWFFLFLLMGDWIYSVHSRWFTMSREAFDMIFYCGIGLYKLLNLMLFLVPYICLRIVLGRQR